MIQKTIVCCLLLALSIYSCKPKQKTVASEVKSKEQNQALPEAVATAEQNKTEARIIGKVSHQYRQSGCSTVVVVTNEAYKIILIPKDKLPVDLDVDGQEISFYYRTLKMPQPAGCVKGMPAVFREIEKVKG